MVKQGGTKMNHANIKTIKKEHGTNCSCSICGHKYKGISFKSGYICETCLEYIKESYISDTDSAK